MFAIDSLKAFSLKCRRAAGSTPPSNLVRMRNWEETMLKTFAIALLATAMSVGLAQAMGMRHMHKHVIPGCGMGRPAAATCACGTAANHRPLLCHKGQWCHPSQACTA